ncbi:MAG: YHS domain-containing (seleno)protein [Porticoccaceae bacterium]
MKLKKLFIGSFFIFASQQTLAAEPVNSTWLGNLAIEGYDTVAYFTDGKAIEGKKEFQTEWMGANWRFANEDNLALFLEDPEKYVPQYGGYCAYAVSNDTLASIDPEQFHIHNGKLYLNYNAKIQKQWLQEKVERIDAADQYFPDLID